MELMEEDRMVLLLVLEDLEDRSLDDGSKRAEVCHIHSRLLSHVQHLEWKDLIENIYFSIFFLLVLQVSEASLGSNRPLPSVMMALHSLQV